MSSPTIDQIVREAAEYGTKVGLCIGGGGVSVPFRELATNGMVEMFTPLRSKCAFKSPPAKSKF